MPLLNKKPFKPNAIPDSLGPSDEVFFHELTNEIFTSHDAFFDRFILCNSLIWTCSRTGKSGLTYQEALDSEQSPITAKRRKKGKRTAQSSDGTSSETKLTNNTNNNISTSTPSSKTTQTNNKTSAAVQTTPTDGDGSDQPVKKKKKKYPYDPKKYSMPVPEGFDPSLLTPTGKIDGRKLKSKKNKQLAEELFSATEQQPASSPAKKGRKHKDKEEEAKKKEEESRKKEEEAKRKAQAQAELAKERELEAKRKKEAAALARQLERQKREEEKKRAAAFLQNWEKKCEDLERDDLKRLPQPTPVICDIPERLFGDSIFIMEAIYNFHDLYNFNELYAEGLDFDTLEEILLDEKEEGALGTLIQFLLRVIFDTQPTKDGYGLDDDFAVQQQEQQQLQQHQQQGNELNSVSVKQEQEKLVGAESRNSPDEDEGIENHVFGTNGVGGSEADENEDEEEEDNEDKDVNMNDLIGSAIRAAREVKLTFSKPLPEMEITPSNVTEILRLHLLQSGSFPKGRTIYNGWYSSREDPGLWLCMQEPDLIKKLGEGSIYDLDIEERIKILHTLINQLLTFIKTRLFMDMASDQLTELRKEYRREAADFARWDREHCVKRMQPPRKKTDPQHTTTTATAASVAATTASATTNNTTKTETDATPMEEVNSDIKHAPNDEVNGHNGEISFDDKMVVDGSEQNLEELERAYQQNTVDYEDYQRERAIRQGELNEKLLDIRINLRNNQSIYAIHPIGRDRAYRRYWLFQSMPGLFVEQDDEFVGKCLSSPTPLESRYKKLFNTNGADNNQETTINAESNEQIEITDRCTGDESTCYIHGQMRSTETKWWFYHQPEMIDKLLEGLNKRGHRESELHDVLSAESSIIKTRVAECPAYKLNSHILELSGIRRSRRLRTKGGKKRGRKDYD